MTHIITLALAAVLIENVVLVKILGICPFLGVSKKTDTALGMGMAVIFVITVANVATWAVNEYLLVPYGLEYMRTVAFILLIASLVQLVEMFMRRAVPALYQSLGIYLPLITTNCAVLGAALIATQNSYNLLDTAVYGFFVAVGFTLALVIFSAVRESMEFNDIPEAFKGFPIALVTAALIAMAFMGFQGLAVG